MVLVLLLGCLTVCVTRVWVGVDNVWEQEKPEARKMLENAAESHTSGARFVGTLLGCKTTLPMVLDLFQADEIAHETFLDFYGLSQVRLHLVSNCRRSIDVHL